MIFLAVTGKKVKGMTVKPNFLATVPSPAGIRVRKPAVAFAIPVAVFFAGTDLNSIAGRGDRKTGAIPSGSDC